MESNIAGKIRERPSSSVLQALKRLTHLAAKESAVYCPSPISSLGTVGSTTFWHMTVVEPVSAQRCSFRRTLYTTKSAHDRTDSAAQVARLEAEFIELTQQLEQQYGHILESDGSIVLSTIQEDLRHAIQEHLRKERRSGQKISPAQPLEIASEVNSTDCGIAEKCELMPWSLRTWTDRNPAVCRELDALTDATSCLGVGTMAQGLAW
jgi:hypothetical protein